MVILLLRIWLTISTRKLFYEQLPPFVMHLLRECNVYTTVGRNCLHSGHCCLFRSIEVTSEFTNVFRRAEQWAKLTNYGPVLWSFNYWSDLSIMQRSPPKNANSTGIEKLSSYHTIIKKLLKVCINCLFKEKMLTISFFNAYAN